MNNFCIDNLGITSENYTNGEFYIDGIFEFDKNIDEIEISMKKFIKSKNVFYSKIIFENNDFHLENNNENSFNFKRLNVDTYADIVSYTKLEKQMVSDNFTYEVVLFKIKDVDSIYMYTSFFHGVTDGIGMYSALEEAVAFLNGSIPSHTNDYSTGNLDYISINNEDDIDIIEGKYLKKSVEGMVHRYTLSESEVEIFNRIKDKYSLSTLELTIAIMIKLNYLLPESFLESIDCIFNLRKKKDLNTQGMYANILPMNLDFNYDLNLSNMRKIIGKEIYSLFKKRAKMRYKFGTSNAKTLISAIHLKDNSLEKIADWVNNSTIYYNYFITITEISNIVFDIQANNELDFDSNLFFSELVTLIKDIDSNFNNELVNEKPLLQNNFNKSHNLKNSFEKVLNSNIDNFLVYDDKAISTGAIRAFILENSKLVENSNVVCILGDDPLKKIMLALTALYTGKSYAFISNNSPKDYNDYIVDKLNAKIFNTDELSYSNQTDKKISFNNLPYFLCYFMTSGSTGFPKLIPVKGESILSFIDINNSKFTMPMSNNLLTSELSFDLSLHALYNTILNGGSLVIVNLNRIYESSYLEDLINNYSITHALFTPSLLSMIDFPKIQSHTIFGSVGEALPSSVARKIINNNLRIFNMYGPTEATCYVTEIEITDSNIPIGAPIDRVSINIIDSFGNLLPNNYEGEIVIAGDSVFEGYVTGNGSEFAVINGIKYYKTGDIGYFDGTNFYFTGRKDSQIKINGYRIEISKIEDVLSTWIDKSKFHIMVVGKELVVFYAENISFDDLILKMEEYLPQYMIPKRGNKVNEIPVTINHKIDTKALLNIDKEIRKSKNMHGDYNEEIMNILLEAGIDLNNALDYLIPYSGLNSLQIIYLQKELAEKNYFVSLEELFKLKVEDLLKLDCSSTTKRSFDTEFRDEYDPSPIQNKFILNYLKGKKSIDNVGAVIYCDTKINAEQISTKLKNKIINEVNFQYRVQMSSGKIKMSRILDADFEIREYVINSKDEIKDYIKHFDIFKDKLYNISIFDLNSKFYVLVEIHHLLVDGISLQSLLSDDTFKSIPYHNYNSVISFNKDNSIDEYRNHINNFFDTEIYVKRADQTFSTTEINYSEIEEISKLYSISHEAIFATCYTRAMMLPNAVICTPVNLREYVEDYNIIGPLINLVGFGVSTTNNIIDDLKNSNEALVKSLGFKSLELENIQNNSDTLMTHLVTLFDSYNIGSSYSIDYALSNSLYEDKFKFNLYIYYNNGKYILHFNSYYISSEMANEVLNKIKLNIKNIGGILNGNE